MQCLISSTSTRPSPEPGGIALRYGGFYGAPFDGRIVPARKRSSPIVGDGAEVQWFIHLAAAAAATVHALDRYKPDIPHR